MNFYYKKSNLNRFHPYENSYLFTKWIDTPVVASKNQFLSLYVIGKGGFGRVWKVQDKKSDHQYAMKEMSKQRILAKKSVNSVLNERNLLSKLHHDFIVNMKYAFQDRENLYLIMDLLSGGDLRYHICKHRKFTEQQTKFFAANIILALEYLHNNSIIHRDIKPENLVFDDKGYLRVTDFGIARIWNPENKKDTSGTPGYMGKLSIHLLFSSRSHVPTKSRSCSWLFCFGCHRLWMNFRIRKYTY